MSIYLALLLCFVPFILCLVFFKIFSSIKVSTELEASLFGLLSVLPITFIQFFQQTEAAKFFKNLNPIIIALVSCFVLCGIVEEAVKTLFTAFIPKKKISFNNYFMASLLAGLCVGCFETLVYFLVEMSLNQNKGGEFLYSIFFLRTFSSDLIHMFCTGLCGLFVWSLANGQKDISAFVMAILIHGLYDFFAQFQTGIKYFAVAAVLFAILECRIHYVKDKPVEEYKKAPAPSKINSDKTIESALRDAPSFDSKRK